MKVIRNDEKGHIDVCHSQKDVQTCGTEVAGRWIGRLWKWNQPNGPKLLKSKDFTSEGEFLAWAQFNEVFSVRNLW